MGGRVDGIDDAFKFLDTRIAEIKDASQAGFWEAGLKVVRSAQGRLREGIYSKGATNDSYKLTGNLRASAYVRSAAKTNRPAGSDLITELNEPVPTDALPPVGVELGFTANYAIYQHENMEGRAPKFLEHAITENADAIVEIIKRRSGGK